MKPMLAVILATAISILNTAAEAGQFDGWCFMQDECAGPSKIQNNQFATCEENCELTKPTKVSGLNALLFEVICSGEEGKSSKRMLMMQYSGPDGKERALAVDKTGAQELQRCRGGR